MTNITRGLLSTLLVAGAIGITAPILAHPDHGPGDGEKTKKVIVITDGKHGEGGERHVRRVRVDGEQAVADCGGERSEVSETTGSGDNQEKTRIVFCDKGDLTSAQRAEKLEQAATRIAADDELSAEHKQKVTAALRAEIARLRNAP